MSSDSATLACTYAALMLHEGGAPMTAENIAAAVAAAGVEVRPTLPIIFARFLQKKSISELMNAASAQAASTAAAAAPASAGGAAPAAAAGGKKEAKKVESESDDDGVGFGLFD